MDQLSDILIKNIEFAVHSNENAPAIVIKGTEYSYLQLWDRAGSFASILTQDDLPFIGILAERSLTAYAGILGILRAGKAYMPLNPAFPIKRLAAMIRASGVKEIIVGDECSELAASIKKIFPDIHLVSDPKTISKTKTVFECKSNDPAYLLFTSGSTGTPKGVAISNQNVCSYLKNILQLYPVEKGERFSHTFDLTFDLSVHDMFVCWISGGSLIVPPSQKTFSYAAYIRENNISVWFSVPSLARIMHKMRLLKPDSFPQIKLSFFCGEAFLEQTASAWRNAAINSRIVNLYGPTEATIAISEYELPVKNAMTENGIVSIGKLFPDQEYTLGTVNDRNEEGELFLHGSQVISEYFSNEKAAEAFREIQGKKWYQTGDLVRHSKDGLLLFLGRCDQEVKISGYRVNLSEIEFLIRAFLKGTDVACVSSSEKIFIFASGKVDELSIIEHCKANLPWYMIPEAVFCLDEMPLNNNGKINRKVLKVKLEEWKKK